MKGKGDGPSQEEIFDRRSGPGISRRGDRGGQAIVIESSR